jgi:flavodoxin
MTATPAFAQETKGKVLVAYLTRSGNTQVIAGQISRSLKADLFQIRTSEPYPADYFEMVAQAERERAANFEPPLAELVTNMASYNTVFLGYPIWGQTAPSVIRSFLARHDLASKTLVPFVTHGGYGLGNSLEVVAAHAPGAKLIEGLTMEADQERRTVEAVTAWLEYVDIAR